MRHPSSGGIRDHKDIAEMDEKNDDDETKCKQHQAPTK
jgi:hypothetical protein